MSHVRSRRPLYRGLGAGGLTAILGSALAFGCSDDSRSGSPSSSSDSGSTGGSSGSSAGGTGGTATSGGRSGSGGGGAQSGGATAAGGADAAGGAAGGQSAGGSTAGDGGPDAGGSPGAGGASGCLPSSSGSADGVDCDSLCANAPACSDASAFACVETCQRMRTPACRRLLSSVVDRAGNTPSWDCSTGEPTLLGCEMQFACATACADEVVPLPDGGLPGCASSSSGTALGIDCQGFCASIPDAGFANEHAECVASCEARSTACPGAFNALVDCTGTAPAWTFAASGAPTLQGCALQHECFLACNPNQGPRCPSTPTGASASLDCAAFCSGVTAAACTSGSAGSCETRCEAAKTTCAPAFDALLACTGTSPSWQCNARGEPSLECDSDQCWAACVERP